MKYDSPEFTAFVESVQRMTENSSKTDTLKLACPECAGEDFSEMIKIVKDEKNGDYCFIIDGHKIDRNDFGLLRQLVLYQNFPDYQDDSWVDPEVRKDYEERLRLERQKGGGAHATLERKVVCLSISTNYTFDQIYRMPIRKFTMALSAVDDLINYQIMRTGLASGFASLPKGKTIEHWIYKTEKDMYGDAYKDVDQVKQEVANT